MFGGAFLIFWLLAAFDDYTKTAVIKHLFGFGPSNSDTNITSHEKQKALEFIKLFNHELSNSYKNLKYNNLMSYQIEKSLLDNYIEELNFLRKNDKNMNILIKEIYLLKAFKLNNSQIRLKTKEHISYQYTKLSTKSAVSDYKEEEFTMTYILEPQKDGFKLVSIETENVSNNE